MPVSLEVSYFNTFYVKRIKNRSVTDDNQVVGAAPFLAAMTGVTAETANAPTPPAPNPYPATPYPQALNPAARTATDGRYQINIYEDWFVEESRIRGGFNNTSVDFGNKAYIVEEEEAQERLKNTLIYSGIYNSRTGLNNSNQFPIGEAITRAVDPASGSIQKLYAENTNLIILQEAKINRAPIDKDVIFTQEGQPLTANSTLVIGTPSPFEGNFGISRDPGSFAVYGYNKYFTDKDRSAVIRLGQNGVQEISNAGMIDYFRDTLADTDETADLGAIRGAYDVHNKNYVLTIITKNPADTKTVMFDDLVNGWTGFQSYIPERSTSIRGNFWSFKYAENGLHGYLHYQGPTYNQFYGVQYNSEVTFIFNPQPTLMKNFNTLNYTGSNGWEATVINTEFTGVDTNPQQPALGDTNERDSANVILSYDEGYYVENGVQYRAGFYRKQNTYYANLVNNSPIIPGEVVFGNQVTGMKGFFAKVTLRNDATTDVSGPKYLFSVGSEYMNR
tara:strand:+ start:904 stop:2415 length:1512 start_codon:yes stop_codon:yes gene_type:complete